jgi:hypothetical protein
MKKFKLQTIENSKSGQRQLLRDIKKYFGDDQYKTIYDISTEDLRYYLGSVFLWYKLSNEALKRKINKNIK